MSITDRYESLLAVYEGVQSETSTVTADGMIHRIEHLFSDKLDESILLSTIHRAKGLEFDHVFLLRPELIPHPMAKSESSQSQEKNLKYVAITRARLIFAEVVG